MSERVKYRLPPEVFDALHLSALANGGIAPGPLFRHHATGEEEGDTPCCVHGHALWLENLSVFVTSSLRDSLATAGLDGVKHDIILQAQGRKKGRSIPFERWCELVGVDVEAPAHV